MHHQLLHDAAGWQSPCGTTAWWAGLVRKCHRCRGMQTERKLARNTHNTVTSTGKAIFKDVFHLVSHYAGLSCRPRVKKVLKFFKFSGAWKRVIYLYQNLTWLICLWEFYLFNEFNDSNQSNKTDVLKHTCKI